MRHNLLEFAELFLFLLAAMTYINAMDERGVFDVLRVKLVTGGYSLRAIFWITGVLAFFMSPIADNLTTALLLSTVAIAVGGQNTKFIAVACINIVVAANAGGAFSPFGDITTLMVWQKGIVEFQEFFALFIPSVVNWLIPAVFLSLAVGKEAPDAMSDSVELGHHARLCSQHLGPLPGQCRRLHAGRRNSTRTAIDDNSPSATGQWQTGCRTILRSEQLGEACVEGIFVDLWQALV